MAPPTPSPSLSKSPSSRTPERGIASTAAASSSSHHRGSACVGWSFRMELEALTANRIRLIDGAMLGRRDAWTARWTMGAAVRAAALAWDLTPTRRPSNPPPSRFRRPNPQTAPRRSKVGRSRSDRRAENAAQRILSARIPELPPWSPRRPLHLIGRGASDPRARASIFTRRRHSHASRHGGSPKSALDN